MRVKIHLAIKHRVKICAGHHLLEIRVEFCAGKRGHDRLRQLVESRRLLLPQIPAGQLVMPGPILKLLCRLE